MMPPEDIVLESSDQCEYVAGVAGLFTLAEARIFVPVELIVEEGSARRRERAA